MKGRKEEREREMLGSRKTKRKNRDRREEARRSKGRKEKGITHIHQIAYRG